MKQIRTVRHSFNTIGAVNYRVQLAVLPSTTIKITIVMIMFSKKVNKHASTLKN